MQSNSPPIHRRRRGRPPQLTREDILGRAAEFDLRDLSVRGLAARMRVSDAAIHYHFGNRANLLRALAEMLTEGFRPAPAADWRSWMRGFAEDLRRLLHAHPGAAEYMVGDGPAGPRQLRIIDDALSLLVRHGFDLERAWFLYATVVNFVLRQVSAEQRAATGAGAEMAGRIALLAGVGPETDLENVALLSQERLLDRHQALFAFGLDAILNGVEPSPANGP